MCKIIIIMPVCAPERERDTCVLYTTIVLYFEVFFFSSFASLLFLPVQFDFFSPFAFSVRRWIFFLLVFLSSSCAFGCVSRAIDVLRPLRPRWINFLIFTAWYTTPYERQRNQCRYKCMYYGRLTCTVKLSGYSGVLGNASSPQMHAYIISYIYCMNKYLMQNPHRSPAVWRKI